MNWITLTSEKEVEALTNLRELALIYKHSPRCMTSLMAFRNMKSGSESDYSIPFYMVDVIQNRDISRLIAEKFNIRHESPQVLIVKDGKCIFDTSHESIVLKNIVSKINSLQKELSN
ncbi:bacillithiol system redox-active protein YtxJ [Dyadobacter subterraneus]|uniref:Bacillithiol system redox-active protein YtxJ n=1 Tax=Dyadobacter subterraneus TaxID=2773304 RepID=A0ABR9WDL9_9BACT|nr:bacillithiol system redox-active protein YtxJ [Dyadobacter subterraneus]MBE9462456.1 bacillithiol system redox-active protein YtxJ [Dyadobacter subterraneus]